MSKATISNPKKKQVQPSRPGQVPRHPWDFQMILPPVVAFLLYLPALRYGFVPNWDDGGYVLNNPVVHSLSWDHIREIFTAFYKGNYHPLTTLLYAFIYAIGGDQPVLYHLINILFHSVNTLLVYLLIRQMLRSDWKAFWTAILFAVHPMHIESVAWISELKDVLYTFFYLLALLYYIRYVHGQFRSKWKPYALAMLFFGLSLLSKSAAVTLSVLMFLIDWIIRRRFSIAGILDKVPFLALSVLFGILAIMSQGKQGAIQDLTPIYTIGERAFIVSYATMTYVVKFLAPVHLSAMYPYPGRVDGMLPWEVYAALPLVLVLLGLLALTLRKSRIPAFGGLFFLITASLTLQVIPVGGAVVAERYTYVPYIGMSLIPLFFLFPGQQVKPWIGKWQNMVMLAFSMFLITLSINRMPVWKDGIRLFTDVIEKYPNLPFAYNNRGYAYQTFYGDDDKAFQDYNQAIAIDSTYHQSLSNRGVMHHKRGEYEKAIQDFSRSLRYNPANTDALIGRANTLSMLKRYTEALPDYDQYLTRMPEHAEAWHWRGVAYYHLDKPTEAVNDFRKSLELQPLNDETLYWMGLAMNAQGKHEEAITWFDKTLTANSGRTEAWVWKGIAFQTLKRFDEAIAAYSQALGQSPNEVSALYNRAVCYTEQGKFREALSDLEKAASLGYPVNPSYYADIQRRVR